MDAHGGDHGVAIRVYGEAVLFRGTKGDLLRLPVRKTLAPQVALAFDGGDEVHPGVNAVTAYTHYLE